MPTALDRLLASPSALRALRTLLAHADFPTITSRTTSCCFTTTSRSQHNSRPAVARNLDEESPPPRRNHDWHARRKIPLESELHISLWGRIAKRRAEDRDEILARALSYADRIHGAAGVREMWLGVLRHRHNLPTADTAAAEIIWGIFVKHEDLLMPVVNHAVHLFQTTGRIYPHLYLKCMEHWLLQNPDRAAESHHRMLLKLRLRKLPLRELIQRTSHSSAATSSLIDIYKTSNERNVYDVAVPLFCDRNQLEIAYQWHTLCSRRDDLPSTSVRSHPMIRMFLARSSIDIGGNDKDSRKSPDMMLYREKRIYNEDLKLRLQGRKIAPVRFDDAFCAKLFATKAFQPTSIIQGLVMVGINEIGPQALRILGLRTDPLEELPIRLQELKAAGIGLQACVYSLALEKFAQEGKFRLVRSMLESDQHPDVFSDSDMQKQLLDYYVGQHDWEQAHRTLAILSLFHNDVREEHWNLVLQAHIKRSHRAEIVQTLQDMRTHFVLVSVESFAAIRSMLRPRRKGKLPAIPQGQRFDDLRFVTRLFIMILESGIGYIPIPAWYEIMRRYGMLLRIKELSRLCMFLLSWYIPRTSERIALPKPEFLDFATQRLRLAYPAWHYRQTHRCRTKQGHNQCDPVQQLFPPRLQQALIVWGFQAGLKPAAPLEQHIFSGPASKKHFRRRLLEKGLLSRGDWSKGLKLLVRLRNHGVRVHHHTTQKALDMQLINLFGHGWSNKRINRIMKRVNTKPYHEYVKEINAIWGQSLYANSHEQATHEARFYPRLPRQNRRSQLAPDGNSSPYWRNGSHRRSPADVLPLGQGSDPHFQASPINAKGTDPNEVIESYGD